MTTNQIEYWKLQENIRHNKVAEAETQRHNVRDEAINARSAEASYLRGMGGYMSGSASVLNAETNKEHLKLDKTQVIGHLALDGIKTFSSFVSAATGLLKVLG